MTFMASPLWASFRASCVCASGLWCVMNFFRSMAPLATAEMAAGYLGE